MQPKKVLEILWEEVDYILVFDFSEIYETYKTLDITKRHVLKVLAMFYDPIGLLQPIFINLKKLFRAICKQKLNWDELLPDHFKNEFEKIMLSLEDMEKISVARCFTTNWLPTKNRITWFQRRKFKFTVVHVSIKKSFKIRSSQCTLVVKTHSDKKRDNANIGMTGY